MKLIFATSNPHKIREINELIGDKFKLLGLHDINCFEDIPETQPTTCFASRRFIIQTPLV